MDLETEEQILDLPKKEPGKKPEYKWIRVLSLGSFILALIFRLFNWPGHVLFILTGAGFFLIWSVLRYYFLPVKSMSENFYLPARILLVSGLTIRYSFYWRYDKYLVYIGLILLLVALVLSFRER